MQDLIKESTSEFEEKFIIPEEHFGKDFYPNGYKKDIWGKYRDGVEILDWHTKQMVKAYNKCKTDLLNALIEREEKEIDEATFYTEEKFNTVYQSAKTDTINHLISLRDE